MTAATITGTCACGTEVEREAASGPGAQLLNRIPFRCPTCERMMLDELDRETAAQDATRARRRVEAELPAGLRRVDLEQLDPAYCADAIGAARRWGADGGGLLLTGPFGVGKTTIAAGAFRLRVQHGPGHWTSAPLMMARLGSGFRSPQRDQALEVLTGRGALVIDDLDKTRPTEYGAEQIFLAVDLAVANQRPLLVTTNLTPGELAQRWPEPYGEAIASRLVGACRVVRVDGPDRRLLAGGRSS